jgi:HNH endonuclease.
MSNFTDLNCEMIDPAFVDVLVEKAYQSVLVEKKKGNYDQAGKKNNNYKNGISTYTQHKKSKCQQCGSTKNLMVHHKDGNRKNNNPSNLETLCWSCHEKKTKRK